MMYVPQNNNCWYNSTMLVKKLQSQVGKYIVKNRRSEEWF